MSESILKAMIVYAWTSDDDYLNDLKVRCKRILENKGFEVEESPLYDMNFNLAISLNDYPGISADSISEAQMKAYPDNYSNDILQEMNKLKSSQLIIIITPLTYGLFPSILHGWIQRVFPLKFAVFSQDKLLDGKKIAFLIKLEEDSDYVSALSLINPMIHHNFANLGMICLDPCIFFNKTDPASIYSVIENI